MRVCVHISVSVFESVCAVGSLIFNLQTERETESTLWRAEWEEVQTEEKRKRSREALDDCEDEDEDVEEENSPGTEPESVERSSRRPASVSQSDVAENLAESCRGTQTSLLGKQQQIEDEKEEKKHSKKIVSFVCRSRDQTIPWESL